MMVDNGRTDEEVFARLPNGVALSWGLARKAKRGPKGEMSVPQIVEAAVKIADEEGLAAVSMNRVASALGFTTMSLYRYISSKDDLLVLMQDAVCAISIPSLETEVDWRESFREYVRACIGVFRNHPWFGEIPISGVPLGPNNMQVIDWVMRTMRDFPLSDYEKLSLVLLLSGYARSSGTLQRDFDKAMQAGVTPEEMKGLDYGEAMKRLVTKERFPYLHPIVMSGTYTGENDLEEEKEYGNDIDFGLERILDGIEHYLDRKKTE